MKILSIVERNDQIVVTTDYVACPEFVYAADKFKDLHGLRKEINKKIKSMEKKAKVKKDKVDTIVSEFNKEVELEAYLNEGEPNA